MSVGVYYFLHPASGYVYVGSSMDLEGREAYWRAALLVVSRGRLPSGYPWPVKPSRRFRSAVEEVGLSGWRFVVRWRLAPDVSPDLLWRVECDEIQVAMDEPGWRLLNVVRDGTALPFGPRPTYRNPWPGKKVLRRVYEGRGGEVRVFGR